MSLLLASTPVNIVSLSGGRAEVSDFTSPNTAQIDFNSDGTITGLETGADKWFALAPSVGIGADYEIFAERTAGVLPTGTMDTWLALSSNRSWSVTQAGAGETSSTILVKIRTSSGGLLASASYDLFAEVIA